MAGDSFVVVEVAKTGIAYKRRWAWRYSDKNVLLIITSSLIKLNNKVISVTLWESHH